MQTHMKEEDVLTMERNKKVSYMKQRLLAKFYKCDELVKEASSLIKECKDMFKNKDLEADVIQKECKKKVLYIKQRLTDELSECEKLIEEASSLLKEYEDRFRVERTAVLIKEKMECMSMFSHACEVYIQNI